MADRETNTNKRASEREGQREISEKKNERERERTWRDAGRGENNKEGGEKTVCGEERNTKRRHREKCWRNG